MMELLQRAQLTVMMVLFLNYIVTSAAREKPDAADSTDGRILPHRSLCDKAGCSCNPKNAEEATQVYCGCRDSVDGSAEVFKIKSRLPPKMKIFTLKYCNKVILDENLFSKHNMTMIAIEDCDDLLIKERSLRSVKEFRIRNVVNVELERNALKNALAERIEFDNVSIAAPSIAKQVHSEIDPEKVTSQFKFSNSQLPNGLSLKLTSGNGDSDLLVGFYNCVFGKPDTFQIKSSRFEMIGNSFHEPWFNGSAVTNYQQQVKLSLNSLAGSRLPSVMIETVNASIEIIINPIANQVSEALSRLWLEGIGLLFRGTLNEGAIGNCYPERHTPGIIHNKTAEPKITCESKESLENFLKSEEFFDILVGKRSQAKDSLPSHSSSPANQINPMILMIIIMLTSNFVIPILKE